MNKCARSVGRGGHREGRVAQHALSQVFVPGGNLVQQGPYVLLTYVAVSGSLLVRAKDCCS